jgi:hypothetical protein
MPFIRIVDDYVNIQFNIRKTGGNETYGGKTIREILTNLMQGSADYNDEIVDILTNPEKYYSIKKSKETALKTIKELDKLEPGRYALEQNIFEKRSRKVDVKAEEMQSTGEAPVYSYWEPVTSKNYFNRKSVTRTIKDFDIECNII